MHGDKKRKKSSTGDDDLTADDKFMLNEKAHSLSALLEFLKCREAADKLRGKKPKQVTDLF